YGDAKEDEQQGRKQGDEHDHEEQQLQQSGEEHHEPGSLQSAPSGRVRTAYTGREMQERYQRDVSGRIRIPKRRAPTRRMSPRWVKTWMPCSCRSPSESN